MTDIVKSGWLYRQSTTLKRWKREWFVLYLHGELRYYEEQTSTEAEGIIHMRVDCVRVKTGTECGDHTAPVHLSNDSFFMIEFRDGTNMLLCGESLDDMRAWQLALEQARVILPPRPGRPQSYPQTYPQGPSQATAVTADGRHVPVFVQGGYHYPPGGGYYYTQPPPPGSYVYYGANGQPVYTPACTCHRCMGYYRGRRCDGGDLALGMLGGAALGSLLFFPPFFMFPFFWC